MSLRRQDEFPLRSALTHYMPFVFFGSLQCQRKYQEGAIRQTCQSRLQGVYSGMARARHGADNPDEDAHTGDVFGVLVIDDAVQEEEIWQHHEGRTGVNCEVNIRGRVQTSRYEGYAKSRRWNVRIAFVRLC